jgi:hypothetical protein
MVGRELEHFAAKQLHEGVADALARLKDAAETKVT